MYCSNCFMLTSLSLIPNWCATGMEGNTFPFCRRTALRPILEESMNSFHSSEQWLMFNALNKPSTSFHATRVPSMLKNSSRFFGKKQYRVIFTPLSRYFHCFILDASSLSFIFGSCKSRTISFSSFCVSLWGDSDAGPWKSGPVGSSSWGPVFSVSPLLSPNSNCILSAAPAPADLPHEAQVWWQRVYLDSQHSASSFCSYHLPQEVSSKSSSHCCGLRVPSTPLERQKALPFPYDLSSLQDVLHTKSGAHFLSWSPSLQPKYRSFLIRRATEHLCDANVTSPHT